MPRVSRRPVDKHIDIELKDTFSYLIASLKNAKEIEQFFQDFLTREEKTMLSKRLMLHLMLENRYKNSQIETVLRISKETVRVHKQIWERGSTMYKKIITSIANRERAKLFWKKIEKILAPLDLFMRSRNDTRARAKLASGDIND